jgi:acyl-CoA reductase-like NAD-dependent aldehyde dehydrogenase
MANVGKATSAIWKNMSEEKRQVYREKAARMTREREEEVAAARASKRVKVNESDNEESESDTSESSE